VNLSSLTVFIEARSKPPDVLFMCVVRFMQLSFNYGENLPFPARICIVHYIEYGFVGIFLNSNRNAGYTNKNSERN